MTVRVEPHAYPTIRGQSTNESGGGGAVPVHYLNLDNFNATYSVLMDKSGPGYRITPIYGCSLTISGITANDVTGVSVIEEVIQDEVRITGIAWTDTNFQPGKQKDLVAILDADARGYPATSTTYNRTMNLSGLDSITLDGVASNNAHFKLDDVTITGNVTVRVKVVNSMGTVLQIGEKTIPVTLRQKP